MNKNCGVCNHIVPLEVAQIAKVESDGTLTTYHMGCEYGTKDIKPCEDCGKHRLLCNDCAEHVGEGTE